MQSLQDKFLAFAAYGSKKSETQLDGRSYVKLFKDAGLLKKPLTTTDLVCFSNTTGRHVQTLTVTFRTHRM